LLDQDTAIVLSEQPQFHQPISISKGIAFMAKGQVRSNREARKPKQEKSAVKTENTFANQIKVATKASPQGSKPKS